MSERFKYVISVVVFSMLLIMTEFIMMNMIGRWKRMNDEVENYNNEEFIEILTALGSNTKYWLMVVLILKYAIRGITVSRISILLQKKKTVRAGTRKRSNNKSTD